MTGKPYNQIIEEMSKKLDVEKWKIERLVRTEGAFVTNQAQLSAYYKSGIKQYRYLARLDERTSEACRELNGKVFDVNKAQAGENYPPMHPYCRSVTEAVFDKENKPIENTGEYRSLNDTKSNDLKLDEKIKKGYNKNSGAKKWKYDPFTDTELDKKAKEMYNKFRQDASDIAKIAKNTGFSTENVSKIKSHIFFKKHKLDKGYALFDPNIDMAETWKRLIKGNFNDNDIILLRHELYEIDLMTNKKIPFNEAHTEAEKLYKYKTRFDDGLVL